MSELVANAVVHGSQSEQDVLRLTIEVVGGSFRIEIEQPQPAVDLYPTRPQLGSPGPTGLYLVDQLADDWGAEAGPPGRVWFEFLGSSPAKGEPSVLTLTPPMP